MEIRVCIKCQKELPLTEEFFRPTNKNKMKFRTNCKECEKDYQKKYYQQNKDKLSEYIKSWRNENIEYVKNRDSEYYQKNKEKIMEYNKNNRDKKKEYNKKYREDNSEKCLLLRKNWYKENKEYALQYGKEHYYENKEYYSEKAKTYRAENREKIIECRNKWEKENPDYLKKWRMKNPELTKKYIQTRKAIKNNLSSTLTVEEWEQIKKDFNNTCVYCGQVLPLTQEHFIPLSKGGEYTHNNIIPACQSCNSSKNNKDFFEWYPTSEHFSKARENKILNYLNYTENGEQQLTLAII